MHDHSRSRSLPRLIRLPNRLDDRGRTGEFGCIAGTVGGAVVGGLAGATIGSGTGQLWAVGGGAVLGSAAGSALTCT